MQGEPEQTPAPRIEWRRVVADDFALLGDWLSRPHVHRYWHHDFSDAGVIADFGPGIRGEEPGEDLLVFVDGAPAALVQRSRFADYPDEAEELAAIVDVPAEAVTIDYLVADPAQTGRGLGTAIIRAVVADTWVSYPEAPAIIVPVVAGNIASWRALEKAGFRRVGEGDLEPENPIDEPLHVVSRIDRPSGR